MVIYRPSQADSYSWLLYGSVRLARVPIPFWKAFGLAMASDGAGPAHIVRCDAAGLPEVAGRPVTSCSA